MSKKTKIFFILYIIAIGIVIFTTDDLTKLATSLEYIDCGSATKIPKAIPQLTTVGYTILIVGTPIVLITFSILGLTKAMASGNADDVIKARNNVIKKFIITAVIFLTAAIVQFVVLRATNPADSEDKESVNSCLQCFLYYSSSNCSSYSEGSSTKGHRRQYSNKSQGWNSNMLNSNKSSNKNYSSNVITNSVNGLTTSTYDGRNYALYTPEKVDSNKPLIVFLHGRGEMGSDISKLDGDLGFSYSIKNKGASYNTYILMPQILTTEYWNDQSSMTRLMNLINKVVDENGIDRNRISLWGFSLGANQAPYVINKYPDFFSSAVLISCYTTSFADSFKTVPTYIFQGDNDPHGNNGSTLYTNINNAGGKAYLKKYSNQTHSAFVSRVINDTELDSNYKTIFDWTLAQRRN